MAGHLRRAGVELRRQGLCEEQLTEAGRLYGEGWSLQRLALSATGAMRDGAVSPEAGRGADAEPMGAM